MELAHANTMENLDAVVQRLRRELAAFMECVRTAVSRGRTPNVRSMLIALRPAFMDAMFAGLDDPVRVCTARRRHWPYRGQVGDTMHELQCFVLSERRIPEGIARPATIQWPALSAASLPGAAARRARDTLIDNAENLLRSERGFEMDFGRIVRHSLSPEAQVAVRQALARVRGVDCYFLR